MKKIAVVLMAVLSLACAGCGDSGSTATTPAAPVVSMNDTTNLITLGAGVDGSTLEVAVDGGAYTAFNAATTYDGNHTVKVRVKAAGGNLAGTDTVFTFTATPDATTTITAPVLSSKTTSTINVTPGTFSDADGVQQVVVALYNATRTTRLATAANGQFIGLAVATTYSLRMEGQAKNGTSGLFEDKTSGWTDVVTDNNVVVPVPEVVDAETVITPPTVVGVTTTTINVTPGIFTDINGVQNVVVAIYDRNKTVRLGETIDGKFTGLTSGTLYYLRTEGQAKNEKTGKFEDKTSTWKGASTSVL